MPWCQISPTGLYIPVGGNLIYWSLRRRVLSLALVPVMNITQWRSNNEMIWIQFRLCLLGFDLVLIVLYPWGCFVTTRWWSYVKQSNIRRKNMWNTCYASFYWLSLYSTKRKESYYRLYRHVMCHQHTNLQIFITKPLGI